jgi:hypothetical protein
MYGDIEALLIDWLTPRFTGSRVCAELPATLPDSTIQVVRFGGGRPSVPFDLANVDIDCYGITRAAAHDLAEQVAHGLMFDLPGYWATDGTGVIGVACLSAPNWAPYDNTNVRRMTAAYQIRTHNPI